MQTEFSYQYNASVESVFRSLTNTASLILKLQSLNAQGIEIKEAKVRSNIAQLTFFYEAEPSNNVPAALQSFAKGRTPLTQKENWKRDGENWSGEFEVLLDGVPVKINGTNKITPLPEGGCQHTITQDVSCGIPFLGKMIEEFISKDAEVQLEQEYKFTKENVE